MKWPWVLVAVIPLLVLGGRAKAVVRLSEHSEYGGARTEAGSFDTWSTWIR